MVNCAVISNDFCHIIELSYKIKIIKEQRFVQVLVVNVGQ